MKQIMGRVTAMQDLGSNIFRLTLFAPPVAAEARPGQFVHLKCGDNTSSYILRRPFSVHRIIGTEAFDILVKTVGEGTRWLQTRRPKDQVDVIGPLGRGFDIRPEYEQAMIVAGGMGVAPLVFLAAELAALKVKVYTLMGAATRTELLDFMDLKRLTRRISVATDDGSQGYKGLVTDLMAEEISRSRPDVIFACGPEPMLRSAAGIARRFDVSCQVSMEAVMACGVGACLGCAVAAKNGYLKACADGPVFDAEVLGW